MRERPILFSAPMVRALLAGTKTQTRRVVKLPHQNRLGQWEVLPWGGPNGGRTRGGETVPFQNVIGHSRTGEILGCPYCQPGDRLWVRETFALEQSVECDQEPPHQDGRPLRRRPLDDFECVHPAWVQAHYRATDPAPDLCYEQGPAGGSEDDFGVRWRPSIHMPRWASRILLEVTGVRVERLQDISEADALAEGVTPLPGADMWTAGGASDGPLHAARPQWAYRRLWDQINGAGSWAANPWVWVVEFRRIAP
ncbi:hypothetical protein DBA29_17165 [Xenophilus aerolatus]|nr:hypothetical protein [Xenophilus aerolatus]